MLRLARRVIVGIRARLRRDRMELDLDAELQAYLEAAIDRHIAAGMSREAATRAARIELGSATAVGLVSFTVSERAREIGLRIALGATRGTIQSMFRRSGIRLAAIGTVLGMVGSVALSQLVRGLLFNVDPIDPATSSIIATLLGATVLAACWLPVRRASGMSPLMATRGDQSLSR